MSWFRQTCTSSVGKKYIMAATGFLLGGFLLVHAAGNSSIFWGRQAFNSYARHLHSLGILLNVTEIGLLAVFLVHIYTGLTLFLQNRSARESRYAVQKSAGGRTWGSRTMPYTGLAILAFIILHLINFHFAGDDKLIADIVGPILNKPIYSLLYALAMLVLGLHISHGFWSVFQSVGINHPKYDRFLHIISWTGSLVIAGIFLTLVLLLLFSGNQLG